jgi:hypothetical protein
MSDDDFDDYDAPAVRRRPRKVQRRRDEPVPTICMFAFLTDLVLSLIRFGIGLMGIVGYQFLRQQAAALPSGALLGVALDLMLGLVGIVAAGLMLAKVRWAFLLGALTVLLTVAAILFQLWQTSAEMSRLGAAPGTDPAAKSIAWAIVGLYVVVRLAVLGLYGFGVYTFYQWAERNSE